MCHGIGVCIRRRDQTGDRVSIRVGITTRRGIVNVTLIHGEDMLQDQEKADKASFKAALLESENTVKELIYFCRNNLNDLTVQCFTHKRFMSVQAFIDALRLVYQELGVEGEKGNVSDFVLFVAGEHRDNIYASHVCAITNEHRQVFAERLGMDIEEIEPNLSKLIWRIDGGI